MSMGEDGSIFRYRPLFIFQFSLRLGFSKDLQGSSFVQKEDEKRI